MQAKMTKALSMISREPDDSRIGISRHKSLKFNFLSPLEYRRTPIFIMYMDTSNPKNMKIKRENLKSSLEPNIPEPNMNRIHPHAMNTRIFLLCAGLSFISIEYC